MRSVASWSRVNSAMTNFYKPTPDNLAEIIRSRLPFIGRGDGRSFGDAAYLNLGRTLLSDHFDHFGPIDVVGKTISVGSGCRLGILQASLEAAGWQFPIYGGSQWVTVGGGVASDIHGKSDIQTGSFGNHVERLSFMSPLAEIHECSRTQSPDLFAATVGGMGLTGFITSVTLRLEPLHFHAVRTRAQTVHSLDAMFDLFGAASVAGEYCTWVDLTSEEAKGIYVYAVHIQGNGECAPAPIEIHIPVFRLFNRWSVRLLDTALHALISGSDKVQSLRSFHYAGIHERVRYWNCLYGRSGFLEYHFSLPPTEFAHVVSKLRERARDLDLGLWFGVFKRLGPAPRAGLISFPSNSWSLNFQVADDYKARHFLTWLSEEAADNGGRIYLAKDAVMTANQAERLIPGLGSWREVLQRTDPCGQVQSDLSLRLGLKPWTNQSTHR